jgi:excisionase family DNA binding protein
MRPIILIHDDTEAVQALIARLQGQRTEVELREQASASHLESDGWMSTKEAAAYLRMTPNALHKLTAARSIPFSQPGGPGGKCYFLRSDLDEWRRS